MKQCSPAAAVGFETRTRDCAIEAVKRLVAITSMALSRLSCIAIVYAGS